MSFFDLRILITPLVSSNSSPNNHIIFTLDVIQSLFSMRINMCSSWYEGDNCREDGWLGVISKVQWTIFSVSLKEDYEISSWLSLNYLLPVVNPITVLLFPLCFSMSLSKCPPVLHFQQYCSYTLEVSYWLAEETGVTGSDVNTLYNLLYHDIKVPLAMCTNRMHKS
jgi:hypothetical protein